MIRITFCPQKYELAITGHALQNEKGKDIVCAAVSTLFYTLGQALLDSEEMLKEKPVFLDEEGQGYLSCKPKKKYEEKIGLIYRTILQGLGMIEENYKKYLEMVIVG